jgi:long-chain acyl-CoA synthetase
MTMDKITRLFDVPRYQQEHFPLKDALVTKYDGKWKSLSTDEYIEQADQISRGLIELGIQPNDKIAIISTNNRTEWNVVDIGVLQIGAQDVPIYPTISSSEYAYVLNHSESKICFVSDREVADKVLKVKDEVPSLEKVYSFNDLDDLDSWEEVLELGKDKKHDDELEKRKADIQENNLATLIYTSGTTGKPKGVMLSHRNILSNAVNSSTRLPLDKGQAKALSFLPVCHIYERMLHYMYQFAGVSIYFAESIDTISDNLKEVRPEVMSAVPRLLEKVYDKIIAKGTEQKGIKKDLFFWAVELGLKFEPYGQNGSFYEFKLGIARKLIFSKWQEALGGNLKVVASGSAALQPRLARVFNAANIKVMEGYGLTETSPVVAVNDERDGGFKIGTVGKPIPETEVRIADDGEILVKGPQVMKGYYKNKEQTNEVLKNDYFHTGDIGEIDDEGFLKITDRKKEIFKTSGGKYVAPQLIENKLKQSRFIEQVMVIGEGERMPAALIQPNFEFIQNWATNKEYDLPDSHKEIAQDQRVIDRVQEEVDHYNQDFGQWEQIKKFELTPEEWTIDEGHLTPTMKMKRKNIISRYQDLYDNIYRS